MTAPARTQNQQTAAERPHSAPIANVSLLDRVIEETLRSKSSRTRIEIYLPRGIDFESVMADVYLALRKNPDLAKCDRESLVDAVVEVQQRGLRIGQTCHLVPKGGKVCAWNDIRGDVEMIIRSGACREITPNVVYSNEPFTLVETGTGPEMRHEIIHDSAARGEPKGAYARFWLGWNRYMVKYMPLADIEVVRVGSLTWNPTKVKKCPPWYMLKTVIRQGAKYLPKNKKMLAVYTAFDRDVTVDQADHDAMHLTGVVAGEMVNLDSGEILDSTPAPTDTTAPTRASEEQIERLATLLADERIDEGTRMQVEAKVRKGLTVERAADLIRRMQNHLGVLDAQKAESDEGDPALFADSTQQPRSTDALAAG